MHQRRIQAIREAISADTVYVIDDNAEAGRHTLGRWSVSAGYKVKIYGSTASFLGVVPPTTGGCVILAVETSKVRLEPSEQLTSQHQYLHIIVVAESGDIGYAVRAMKAGATDVVETPYSDEGIVAAVSTALAAPPLDVSKVRKASEARSRLRQWSRREFEVLRELVAGHPNKWLDTR